MTNSGDTSFQQAATYQSYLKIPELLSLQQPVSDGPEHDEMLFIVIHQSYELWFKQLLHELARTQETLEFGKTFDALALLGRVRTILKICVAQIDILETMTPLQFLTFRGRLASASGFQSAQFRQIEAVLGRRDRGLINHLPPGSPEFQTVSEIMAGPSVWDSVLSYFSALGHQVPRDLLQRDMTQPYQADARIQALLLDIHRSHPESALVCERLVDIDEGLQEWRYRHVKMIERTIGRKTGTGGSTGVDYLSNTLGKPVFPDLWEVRSQF
jgi:tryptophan 2,3-dioxygenase